MGRPCFETVALISVQKFCSDPRGGDVTFDANVTYSTVHTCCDALVLKFNVLP
jgi:hypothetical protein